MPRYAASISEMLTMPVGVLTTDYIDVWCNTATDTPHKICVGDMIAVKWNADVHDREYTWCTVLATTHVASGAELTLMHEQAVDVPGHPSAEPTHVTYNWKQCRQLRSLATVITIVTRGHRNYDRFYETWAAVHRA